MDADVSMEEFSRVRIAVAFVGLFAVNQGFFCCGWDFGDHPFELGYEFCEVGRGAREEDETRFSKRGKHGCDEIV